MLGVIGAGNMASAIVAGLVQNKVDPASIVVSDINQSQLDYFQQNYQVKVTQDNQSLLQQVDTVLLAIKPQQMELVCGELQTHISQKLVISIAAGVTTPVICKHLANEVPVIRVMPNLAAMVQTSVSALYANALVTEQQKKFAEQICKSIGRTVWLDKEEDMHTVTALSGSGPSYFFYLMQHMVNAAVDLGLDEATARKLAEVTCIGAGKVVESQQETPIQTLIDQVCSKGGTTEAAMNVFNDEAVDKKIVSAVKAAHARSVALSGE